jgi:hypothetical protein
VWEFVDCPTCPAKTGQKCRTLTTGRVTDTHQLRFDRYHEWRRRELERLFDDHRNPSVTDN